MSVVYNNVVPNVAQTKINNHINDHNNPHQVTRAQLSVTEQGKLKIGNDEYILQIGSASQAQAGYITFVLES